MGETKHKYIIRLEAENGKAVSATLVSLGSDGEKAFNRLESSAGRLDSRFSLLSRTMLTRFLPAISAAALGKSLVENIQAFERLDTRLRFNAESLEDYARAQDFLKTKAQELNIDILALADGYSRLAALQKGGLITSDQTEALLTGLANAKAALGADDTQIAQVIYGMGQAFSQAAVQASEFNQVTEPLPGLMLAIDKAAGLTAGGFRNLVLQGEVTGKQFSEVLVKAFKEYEGAAKSMDGTVSASLTDLKNAWRELSKSIGDSYLDAKLSDIITSLTSIINLSNQAVLALRKLYDPTPMEKLYDIDTRLAKLKSTDRGDSLVGRANSFFDRGEIENLEKQRAKILADIQKKNQEFRQANNITYGPERPLQSNTKADQKAAKDAEKQAKAIREVVSALEFRNAQMKRSSTEQELYNQLQAAGVDLNSEQGQAIKKLVDEWAKLDTVNKSREEGIKLSEQETKQFNQTVEALQKRNELLTHSAEEQELYNQLQAAGVDLDSQRGQQIKILVDEYGRLTKAQEEAREAAESLARAADGIGDAFASASERAVFEGDKIGDILSGLVNDIARTIYRSQVSEPLAKSVSSIASDFLSSIFGGFRASGGPVEPGKPYVVGERGPEVIVPRAGGFVIPNSALRGGEQASQPVVVNVINQSSQPVRAEQRSSPGGRDISIVLRDEVKGMIRRGDFDSEMGVRYGASPKTIGR